VNELHITLTSIRPGQWIPEEHRRGVPGTLIVIPAPTRTLPTKANAEAVIAAVTPERITEVINADNEYKASPEYAERIANERRQARKDSRILRARDLAIKAGLEHDEHGGYERGDYHTLHIIDIADRKSQLDRYFATGTLLILVKDVRNRVYSKSYMMNHGPSYREDTYLVGTNDNGIPFAHHVKDDIVTIAEAVDWIWQSNKILARQGDVAVAECKQFVSSGELVEDYVITDSHKFTGELKRNGSIYIRNGILYHEKDQHPVIFVGEEWVKVVIGRRSTKAPSTAD
jgi:hypothetical protein